MPGIGQLGSSWIGQDQEPEAFRSGAGHRPLVPRERLTFPFRAPAGSGTRPMRLPGIKKEKVPPEERIPRPALAVAGVGLLLSVAIFGISLRGGGSASEVEWDVVEPVKTPPASRVGPGGSLELARTSISALAPNSEGYLLFQIAGVVRIDSGGTAPATLRCAVRTTNAGESMIARTTKKRAAWPRPSEELRRQEVPERSIAKFRAGGSAVMELPIRDVFRRYTDSDAPTLVDWDGYDDRSQNWLWSFAKGTGGDSATLGYAVIFKTQERPTGAIECRAKSIPTAGGPEASGRTAAPVRLKTWPIPDQTEDSQQGSEATDVQ